MRQLSSRSTIAGVPLMANMLRSSASVLGRWVPSAQKRVMFSGGTWASSSSTAGRISPWGVARVMSLKTMPTRSVAFTCSRSGRAPMGAVRQQQGPAAGSGRPGAKRGSITVAFQCAGNSSAGLFCHRRGMSSLLLPTIGQTDFLPRRSRCICFSLRLVPPRLCVKLFAELPNAEAQRHRAQKTILCLSTLWHFIHAGATNSAQAM